MSRFNAFQKFIKNPRARIGLLAAAIVILLAGGTVLAVKLIGGGKGGDDGTKIVVQTGDAVMTSVKETESAAEGTSAESEAESKTEESSAGESRSDESSTPESAAESSSAAAAATLSREEYEAAFTVKLGENQFGLKDDHVYNMTNGIRLASNGNCLKVPMSCMWKAVQQDIWFLGFSISMSRRKTAQRLMWHWISVFYLEKQKIAAVTEIKKLDEKSDDGEENADDAKKKKDDAEETDAEKEVQPVIVTGVLKGSVEEIKSITMEWDGEQAVTCTPEEAATYSAEPPSSKVKITLEMKDGSSYVNQQYFLSTRKDEESENPSEQAEEKESAEISETKKEKKK